MLRKYTNVPELAMVEISLIQICLVFFFCLFVCTAKVKMKEQLGAKKTSICPLMPAVVLLALDLCFCPSSLIKLNGNVWFLNGVGSSR